MKDVSRIEFRSYLDVFGSIEPYTLTHKKGESDFYCMINRMVSDDLMDPNNLVKIKEGLCKS